eukprot:EC839630.1.p1 GENE.EC839630.1~~EC839630.1.p1  ORF type:complete len:237 (+),score=61.36 EC839630.1:32-712(+)
MKEAAAAAASVSQMDKKELDGRAINVELARPRVERPAGAPRPPPRYPPFRRGPRFPRFPPQVQGQVPVVQGQQLPAEPQQQFAGPRGPRGPRFPRGPMRRPRGPRRVPDPNAPLSKTRVFASNLPFALNDEQLAGLFNEFHVKSAHVATRPNGFSRGFGFVELENEESQQAAIAALNGKAVNERAIIVRVAREEPPRPVAPVAAPAPVATTAAPAPVAAPAPAPTQ